MRANQARGNDPDKVTFRNRFASFRQDPLLLYRFPCYKLTPFLKYLQSLFVYIIILKFLDIGGC